MNDKNISNSGRPLCKRCLIRDLNDSDKLKSISEYKSMTLVDDVRDLDTYERLLNICLDCKYLNMGVCQKNGYFVEARLYRKSGKCPMNLF